MQRYAKFTEGEFGATVQGDRIPSIMRRRRGIGKVLLFVNIAPEIDTLDKDWLFRFVADKDYADVSFAYAIKSRPYTRKLFYVKRHNFAIKAFDVFFEFLS